MSALYNILSQLCNERGISAYRMCKDIGLQPSIMTDLKMGRRSSMKAETIARVANYFDVSVDYLLGNTQIKKDDSTEALSSAASLSSSQKQLVELAESLTDDEIKKVLSYIRFVLSERANILYYYLAFRIYN